MLHRRCVIIAAVHVAHAAIRHLRRTDLRGEGEAQEYSDYPQNADARPDHVSKLRSPASCEVGE